jgi:hypothetical protein
MIQDAHHEVQLHLHTEWADEIRPAILEGMGRKRQHLTDFSLRDQQRLISHARKLLLAAGSRQPVAFRAGNYAANRDTFHALRESGFRFDSSLNRCYAVSGPDMPQEREHRTPFHCDGITTFPVGVFRDAFGWERPAHIRGCSAGELHDALWSAKAHGWEHFVIVSHSFEMLKPRSNEPDRIVAARFENLCRMLAQNRCELPVKTFEQLSVADGLPTTVALNEVKDPSASLASTARRLSERMLGDAGNLGRALA